MTESSHQQWKVVILIALENSGANPTTLASNRVSLVEKDCLSHPTQPVEDKAPSRLACAETPERHVEIRYLGISSDQTRRTCACARCVGILVWIHVTTLI